MFLITAQETPGCPDCGKPLKLRDHKKRIHMLPGGEKEWYMIPRLECTNEDCPCKIHSGLPDCMSPYKHYDAGLIEDVVDGVVTTDDLETEDYPCEATMDCWKEWIEGNRINIDGQLRSIGYRVLDFEIDILSAGENILDSLRQKISPGWLKAVNRTIYNTGSRITPLGRLDQVRTHFPVMSRDG